MQALDLSSMFTQAPHIISPLTLKAAFSFILATFAEFASIDTLHRTRLLKVTCSGSWALWFTPSCQWTANRPTITVRRDNVLDSRLNWTKTSPDKFDYLSCTDPRSACSGFVPMSPPKCVARRQDGSHSGRTQVSESDTRTAFFNAKDGALIHYWTLAGTVALLLYFWFTRVLERKRKQPAINGFILHVNALVVHRWSVSTSIYLNFSFHNYFTICENSKRELKRSIQLYLCQKKTILMSYHTI